MEGLFFPKNFGKRTRQWIWKNQSCFSWMGRLPGDGCSPGSVLGVAGAPPQGDIPGDVLTLRDGDPTGIPWMLMPGAALSSLLQQRCCDTLTLLLTIVVWVYPVCLLQKKEGTFSLSFAQSFPFTVSKTTELDAKAGAVGTSAGEVSPACVSHQLLAFPYSLSLPLLHRSSG